MSIVMMAALSDNVFELARRIGRRIGLQEVVGIDRFVAQLGDVPDTERSRTPLHKVFYTNRGPIVQKWRHYLDVYDRHLSRFRNSSFRMLEIGVDEGGSMRLWRDYFGSQAVLFGVDINPSCKHLNGIDAQIRIGSQDDASFLKHVVAEMGGVDVVVDDGSHIAAHQRQSFNTLFPLLNPNGIYICEDLHTSYWRGSYQGGYKRRGSLIEFAKDIIDDLHSDFHRHGSRCLENANRLITGVHFYNSIVVIEKSPQERPSHIRIGQKCQPMPSHK
jgi:hypothetical protein